MILSKKKTGKSISTYSKQELNYLDLLSEKFPSVQSACTEIINLNSILNLPKGTEHFLSDIHGEYDTFNHILRNASGMVKKKIDSAFGDTISDLEKEELATLIYYPEERLKLLCSSGRNTVEWYNILLLRLIEVARIAADKYTRSKVRKAMPKEYAYIIDELLNETTVKKSTYYNSILDSIIDIGRANHFIVAISEFIRRLLIDRLHIIGDIFDRGPYADKVMDEIQKHHSVDIQWGNHDILWMAAAIGNAASIMGVLRISIKYNNLHTLEEAYGINLLPLATFAMNAYKEDDCFLFSPKNGGEEKGFADNNLLSKMHKAVVILEQKLAYEIIKRNPQYQMDDRLLLDKINFSEGTIHLNNKHYTLQDSNFPTINPNNPYQLSVQETLLVEQLQNAFRSCSKLHAHVETLYAKGSPYLVYNSNLLFHGCIPLDKDRTFSTLNIDGEHYKGKALLDQIDLIARRAYFNRDEHQSDDDMMWYLWCGANSPLFGKQKMATFERYFIAEKELHVETTNTYYQVRNCEEVTIKILEEFGLVSSNSHIINGHVPVKVKKGESPVKANGRLFVIDGGMSRPYQKVTGIAGYTLIFDSFNLILAEHTSFGTKEDAVNDKRDIISTRNMIKHTPVRISVGDTNIGNDLRTQIRNLKRLLEAYSDGVVKPLN